MSAGAVTSRRPDYAQLAGGGGEFDQPLSEKYTTIMLPQHGPGQQPGQNLAPESMPRPAPEELATPMRWEAKEGTNHDVQAHPAWVRMTVNAMPLSSSAKQKANLPIGAIIQPLAPTPSDAELPLVNPGASGVVRCRRCRTYVNAFVKFIDGGRRWRCNVCGLVNDTPADYFCELDGEGRRRDRLQRPELCHATTEFVAAAEYMVRPPQPPAYLFVIETSYAAVSSGMLRCVSQTLQHTLDRLPGGERTQVGLITFDNTLHFYDLSGLGPQMLVTPEVEAGPEVFLPLPDDLLVNLSEKREELAGLLEKLPVMFADSKATEVALGPALRAAYQVILT